ncbi:MAG: adenosylhomocysteinase [Candidatus Bathyarchaeia archaeon]
MSKVKDPSLASQGELKIEWARAHMPVLGMIQARFEKEQPFRGLSIGMCMHLEMKTAVLGETFQAGGAAIAITGSNPLSTQDDVAAALAKSGANVYAWRGVTPEEHHENLLRVLEHKPQLVIDDGGELSVAIHTEQKALLPGMIGACEETTTGVHRYRAMEKDGSLKYPVIAVNDAYTKFLFDSQHGTGQSALEGVMRATNMLIAGKTLVVGGFGWVGRGIALRAKGLGAKVVVTEVDPVRALEAVMEGYSVMPMKDAAKVGDIFITATGCNQIITSEHFGQMKDGVILANSGHFDVEVDVKALRAQATSVRTARLNVEEFKMKDGRRIYLLAEGRLVNLAAADGHPAEVMDMTFANQALCAEYLLKNKGKLEAKVYGVPIAIDKSVARLWLESHDMKIDYSTQEQSRYLESWR